MFKDKVIIITGGTGSFGNAVLQRFLNTDVKEVKVKDFDFGRFKYKPPITPKTPKQYK